MQKVCFELNSGKKINIELYPEHAPISVENFLDLVKSGFYDGLCFHRVIPGFMIQGGGFVAENDGLKDKKAPRTIKGEFAMNGVKNDLHHGPGVISMARIMFPDSASSQFFICVDDVPHLDAQYAAFGKVCDEESLNTAIAISTVNTHSWGYYDDIPNDPVVIVKAIVTE
ncbi:MAG: peptidylprolyl isomerase, partial [Clostridia bacterium]|nr:peptidylprolyl isomerase [Clostridia bacterium]